jgi:hypothetical protein
MLVSLYCATINLNYFRNFKVPQGAVESSIRAILCVCKLRKNGEFIDQGNN